MSSITTPTTAAPRTGVSAEAISKTRAAVVLGITVLAALFLYYLIGVDEGMTSLFGHTMVIHEWVHDSRHLLGFPCH